MKTSFVKILTVILIIALFSCKQEENVNTTDAYISVTDAYFCYKNKCCVMPNHRVLVRGFPVKLSFSNYIFGKENYFTIYDPITNYEIDIDFLMVNDSLKLLIKNKFKTFPDNVEFFMEAYYQPDFFGTNGVSDVKIFLNDTTFFIK